MARIKFKKGMQKKFLDLFIQKSGCISLRGILQFDPYVSYDCLKNYYSERRLLPQELFYDLCRLIKAEPESFDVEVLDDNWGKVKGGRS
jgi:hypothetical protein